MHDDTSNGKGADNFDRRSTSRLWYRRPLDAAPLVREVVADKTPEQPMEASAGAGDPAMFESEDEYAYFELDLTGMTLRPLDLDDPRVQQSLRGPVVDPVQASWRTYPSEAKSLILSATENLGTRLMGPILTSGTRYRVVDRYNDVVAVEIERRGLPPMRGYCPAAHLEAAEQCARPKRTGSQVEWIRSVSERMSQSFGVFDLNITKLPVPSRD